MKKEIIIMFDVESRAAFTLAAEEFKAWLVKNAEEGLRSAMPYYTITTEVFMN